jgi:lipoprotein-anchoring transpeptidase ErfK/SrfK
VQAQGRSATSPLVAVVGITIIALGLVGALGVLAARSEPAAAPPAAKPRGGPLPQPTPVAQRAPATSAALPAGTGTGRRIVYALGIHRVWVVTADGTVRRTYQVPIKQPQLAPGEYKVYARRTSVPIGTDGLRHRYVLRMEQGKSGGSRLGFCSVPVTRSGKPAPESSEGGIETGGPSCIVQSPADARYLYKLVPVGTRVVVVP